jgi:hypothetical protein
VGEGFILFNGGIEAVAWCRFFFPKIVTADIDPDDPTVNDNIQYAKCLRGKVLKDANDWVRCEHLPTPDSVCWQEGGKVILPQRARSRSST